MDSAPQQATSSAPRRGWWRAPLWIGLGIVIGWVVVLVGSELLWRHAFGFDDGDAWALSVGLMAYIALMFVAAGVITIGLRGDERHTG